MSGPGNAKAPRRGGACQAARRIARARFGILAKSDGLPVGSRGGHRLHSVTASMVGSVQASLRQGGRGLW